MPLKSKQFKGNDRLKACLVSDPAHVVPGERGEHVGLIQQALMILGAGAIDQKELLAKFYGTSTAQTVFNFKAARNIVRTYQKTPDRIVGKRTIEYLDKEMDEFERRPPPEPIPFSLYVSLTEEGTQPHDHSVCPTVKTNSGLVYRVQHRGTPVYPRGSGRKINIGGEKETSYLGFEDFLVYTPGVPYFGYIRPFTYTIQKGTASDICMRSTLLSPAIKAEIFRIAGIGCRFTYASPNKSYVAEARKMGRLIEEQDPDLPTVVVEII